MVNDTGESIVQKALGKIGSVIDEIVILRVTTVVGTVTATEIESSDSQTRVSVAPEGQLVAHSVINTALGDMNTIYSKGFLEDATLSALHRQALTDARGIRKDSIDMLLGAIKTIRDDLKD